MNLGVEQTANRNGFDWRMQGATFLLALVLAGYPVAATMVTLSGLGSTTVTIPFRALVFGISVLFVAGSLLSSRPKNISFAFLLFGFLYLVRLGIDYTNVQDESRIFILQYYFLIVFVPALAVTLLGCHAFNLKALVFWVVGFTLIVVVGVFMGANADGGAPITDLNESRLSLEALNPISIGNAAVTGSIAAAWLLLTHKLPKWQQAILVLSLLLFAQLLLLAASRGPLLALGLAVVWLMLSRIKYLVLIGPLAVIAVAIYLPNTFLYQRLVGSDAAITEASTNVSIRIEYQLAALEQFADNPIFGDVATLIAYSPLTYPHNIFIETLMGMGLIGMLIMIAILVKIARFFLNQSTDEFLLLKLLFIQYFIGAQFSGALWGSGQLWALLGMLASYKFLTTRLPSIRTDPHAFDQLRPSRTAKAAN